MKIKKAIFVIALGFAIGYLLGFVVYADEVDEESFVQEYENGDGSSIEDVEVEADPTPTLEPTPTNTPTPSPTPTISPTPALHDETIDFYDSVESEIVKLNDQVKDVRYGQFKMLISFWALVGLIAGMRVIKDTMG